MRAWPWILGGGAVAYALTRRSSHPSHPSSGKPEPVAPFAGPLPGRWVWPVPRWNGRTSVISDGFNSPRPGLPRHGGVDLMFLRQPADPFKPGTPNGAKWHVMPDGLSALAASDGVIWSAMNTPHGYAVVIDHTPRKVATFYTHMEKLFVPETAPGKKGAAVRAGQPLGVIGASPLDGEHLKHLLCAAAHNRCNAERSLCGAGYVVPRFCSGCPRSTAHNADAAELFEPGEQVPRRKSVARHLRKRSSHRRDRRLLHSEVDLHVAVCGRELSVAEPRSDGGDVDAGMQKVHGCRVTQHVRSHGLRVPCRYIRACDQSSKNVGDTRSTQPLTADVEEQGFARTACTALVKPCSNRLRGAGPQRARALFAPLADDHHMRNRVEADVADVQIHEFLDAQAGVVEHEHERSISETSTRIRRFDDAGHLVFVEVAHLDVFSASQWQLADPSAALHVFGCHQRDVSSEGLDRGESVIARAGTASALVFKVFEKRTHDGYIQCRVIELLGTATQASTRVLKEQLEGVAIREHGVAARVPLGGEVVFEESLNQGLQGGGR